MANLRAILQQGKGERCASGADRRAASALLTSAQNYEEIAKEFGIYPTKARLSPACCTNRSSSRILSILTPRVIAKSRKRSPHCCARRAPCNDCRDAVGGQADVADVRR